VKAFYEQILPALDSVATAYHVDFPIKGVPAVTEAAPQHESASTDTTTAAHDHSAHAHAGAAAHGSYVQHAQHQIALVKEQLSRLTVNTNPDLQKFAKDQLPKAAELYKALGGKEEAHGHH